MRVQHFKRCSCDGCEATRRAPEVLFEHRRIDKPSNCHVDIARWFCERLQGKLEVMAPMNRTMSMFPHLADEVRDILTAKRGKGEREQNRWRAEKLVALVHERMQNQAEGFYEMGSALGVLLRMGLYQALGYSSFGELLHDRKILCRSQAYKLMTLVDSMPRDIAVALGQERAAALMTYKKRTSDSRTVAQLVRQDHRFGEVPLSTATVRDIAQATPREKTAGRPVRVPAWAAPKARKGNGAVAPASSDADAPKPGRAAKRPDREVAADVRERLLQAGFVGIRLWVNADHIAVHIPRTNGA